MHSAANSPELKKVRDYSRGNLDGVLKFSAQAKGAMDRHVNQAIFTNSIPQFTPRDVKNHQRRAETKLVNKGIRTKINTTRHSSEPQQLRKANFATLSKLEMRKTKQQEDFLDFAE